MKKKVGVIGAGPAGIIAAGIAAYNGNDVYLIEKNNRIGKKLYITGKGRCNITNAIPIDEFFDYIVSNKNFLYSSFYSFTNDDMIDFLNNLNLSVKIERGGRVFPISDKSSDFIKALGEFISKNKVRLLLNSEVKKLELNNGKFLVSINGQVIRFDKLILATGGMSYPLTGSTGDGYRFASKLGHNIIKPKASLVPIETKEVWVRDLQGLSLKNVSLKTLCKGKEVHNEFGEMIFTHFGISGPIVLSTSAYIHKYMTENIKFEIDLKPALSFEKLDERILRDFTSQSNKQFKNSLNNLLPQKIIPIIIGISKIEPDKIINQITKSDRENLLASIKHFPLTFKSLRPIKEAIITSGGIDTEEIDPSTMESKLIKNLYFAGEIIDVDALTGGFNLQIAYSTGYLAGINT